MYKQAFQTYKEQFITILLVTLLMSILSLFTNVTFPVIALAAFIAFDTHRNILIGEKIDFKSTQLHVPKGSNRYKNFYWAYARCFAILILGPLVPAVILTLVIVNLLGIGSFILILLLICAIIYSIMLPLYGSALPAASIGADASYSSALKFSAPKFLYIVWKLAYGPIIFAILTIITAFNMPPLFPSITEGTSVYMVIHVAIAITVGLMIAFATVLVATILSQVYMDS